MKSATSSSKSWFYPTLWKKNMTRFWPIWAVYLACWVFTMPLLLLTDLRGDSIGSVSQPGQYFASQVVREWCTWPALLAGTVFGILSAMAVFSYLYNNRSAGMLHALPVRREGLFLTNYLSGLSFMVLPQVLVFVLTLLAEAVAGYVDALALGQWLLVQICVTLFFYSFAVFCAMFTGHILALPVFYGILNGLATGIYWLVNALFRNLIFGYNGSNGMGEAALWLTPAGKLGSELDVNMIWNDAGTKLERIVLEGMGYALLYAFLGLVLAFLALVLYRRRHLEGAGDVVTVRWVRPIFKYGVAFCTALALGTLLYGWFGFDLGRNQVWGLLAFLLFCGGVGYFAAEMLLKKSFRVLGAWKGWAVFSAALVALALCIRFDVTGYERRVPDPGQVLDVELMSVYSAPEDSARHYNGYSQDPDFIRAVTEFQRSIVDRREDYRGQNYGGGYEPGTVDGLEVNSIETGTTVSLRIDYTMPSGNRVSRSYEVPVRAGDLSDPDSPAARLTALLNRTEDRVEMYFPKELDGKRLMDVSITTWEADRGEGPSDNVVSIPQSRQQDLLDAVKADLAAGRLGIRYLLDDADRLSNCYVNDLEFTFQETWGGAENRGGIPQTMPADVPDGVSYTTVRVTLQDTASSTMALLRELGMEDQVKLVTQAQRQHQYWLEDRRDDALKEGEVYAEAERAYLG